MQDSASSRRLPQDRLQRQLQDLPAFRALLRSVESQLLAGAGALPSPLLDLGCGDGYFALHSLSARPLYGIDANPAELARAAAHKGVFDELVAADAARLPFDDSTFRGVVANSVLEHVADLEGALREAARVLRPGGRLLLTAPSHRFTQMLCGVSEVQTGSISRLRSGYGRWFNARSRHLHLLSLEQWQDHLHRAGLTVREGHYYFSAASLRAFHLLHYLGVPTLLFHRLTGQWVPWRNPWTSALAVRWLAPLATPEPIAQGAYLFIVAGRES